MGGPSGADKGLLAVAEVAEYLGVGQVTISAELRHRQQSLVSPGRPAH